jgi:hypothetical protein
VTLPFHCQRLLAMLAFILAAAAGIPAAHADSARKHHPMEIGVLRSLDNNWRVISCLAFEEWNACALRAFLICRGFQNSRACEDAGDVGGDIVFGFPGESDLPLAAPTERIDYQITRIDRLYDRPDPLIRVEAKTRRCWGRSHGPPLSCDDWLEEYFILWAPFYAYDSVPIVAAWGATAWPPGWNP